MKGLPIAVISWIHCVMCLGYVGWDFLVTALIAKLPWGILRVKHRVFGVQLVQGPLDGCVKSSRFGFNVIHVLTQTSILQLMLC